MTASKIGHTERLVLAGCSVVHKLIPPQSGWNINPTAAAPLEKTSKRRRGQSEDQAMLFLLFIN